MTTTNTATRDGRARDAGFSLVEIIISVVLMGTVVVAVLTAVTTSVKVSATSRTAAQVETAIVNASDRVNRAPKNCDYTRFVEASVPQGWPPNSGSAMNEYYVPGPDAATAGEWKVGSATAPGCPGPAAPDLLVQRVTITIVSPDGEISRSIQVVKSDV